MSAQSWSAIFAGISVFAAVVTVGSSWFLRWRDRPTPEFETSEIQLQIPGDLAAAISVMRPSWQVSVTNVGDGIAHQVRARSASAPQCAFLLTDKSDVRGYRFAETVTMLQPGESAVLMVDGSSTAQPSDCYVVYRTRPMRHRKAYESMLASTDWRPAKLMRSTLWGAWEPVPADDSETE